MRALVFDGELRLEPNHPEPILAAGEALIQVLAAGICNTDVEITKGYMGFSGVLGHEFVGVVQQAEDPAWIGKRVVGEINCPCLECITCRLGYEMHCPRRTVLGILGRDGAFAERVCLPLANLHEVPSGIDDEEAVFVEPLAAAFEILVQMNITDRSRVAVLGDGKLGLLVAQALSGEDRDLIAIGKHDSKLALLRAKGIPTRRAGGPYRPQYDIVIECTGSAQGLADAFEMVRPRGTLFLKSTLADNTPLNLAPIVINEITVIGSRCGPFPRAIEALEKRDVTVRELISARYALDDGVQAFEKAREKGVVKVVLEMT